MVSEKRHTKITINYEWCKKCGICIAFCPKKVYDTDKDGAPIIARPEDCIQCLLCERRCPDLAISVGGKDDDK